MSLTKLKQATTKVEKSTDTKVNIHEVKLDDMLSLALHQFKEGKAKEQQLKPIMAMGSSGMGELKEFARKYIEDNFHGSTPPDRIKLVTSDGAQNVVLSISDKQYGKTKMDRYQTLENAEEIREIVGDEWFNSHVNDNTRVTIHIAMVKDPQARSELEDALVNIVQEFESTGRIPAGTLQVEERYAVKPSFHHDRFELDLARHSELSKAIGGCGLTAPRQ